MPSTLFVILFIIWLPVAAFGHQRFTFARYTYHSIPNSRAKVGYSVNCLTPDGARYSFATGGSVARIQKSVLLIVEPRKSA